MAKSYTTPEGKTIYLMNPSERRAKYVHELKTGRDKFTGKELTERQKSFRAGYMKSSQDNTKAFNHNVKMKRIKKISYNKKKGWFSEC